MAQAFKEHFNHEAVKTLASQLQSTWPEFDGDAFVAAVVPHLPALALKQRSALIQRELGRYLPSDFAVSADVLYRCLAPKAEKGWQASDGDGVSGWLIMPLADYVAEQGQQHLPLALDLLKAMTSRFSSEFAIRPLLQRFPEQTLAALKHWVNDDDEHVRRLVSEGTRPRLPWGIRLTQFIADPRPMLPLLEQLRDDSSEYVRRSVANHLNDIAKDHPELIAELAREWMQNAPLTRQKLLRHGCRTLIKQGHRATLAVFGWQPITLSEVSFSVSPQAIVLGHSLQLQAQLIAVCSQPVVVDFAIHLLRANGATSVKVFKGRELQLQAGQSVVWQKQHAIKAVTTRRYYPGRHRVDLLVNGECVASSEFELLSEA
ncbi:hypothetical protein GCM10011297_02160 [Bacterioplanes sanyensis]|uniref:DNA alkylation repair protein n=1 Tax=Bacterioplanes sanyensis TaxID=1249553 RepID=UPI0016736679|nr:DNA alkylation repair protein [Bacterioplanes sanyensis]GGY32790.1 hypothetical protein GCM10011297_02160 [Bacterioplanes sanyensis]